MYQPYPGGSAGSDPSLPSAPQSVIRAARVMYVGAVASLLSAVVSLTGMGNLRDQIHKNSPKLTMSQIDSVVHVEIALLVVSGLVQIGLWIWMARSCQAGKSWARVVSTLLFALSTIEALFGLTGAALGGVGKIGTVIAIVVWAIGLAVIVLLWQRESSDFFNARRQPR